jgi:hypothetical protein
MPEALDDADRALKAAHLKRARALKEYAENSTEETAAANDAAWAEADEVGRRYLEARFEYEARQAGLYVDPATFVEPGVEEGPIPTPPTHDV